MQVRATAARLPISHTYTQQRFCRYAWSAAGWLHAVRLVEDPVREVADSDVRAVGEEIVEHPVHPFQLPARDGMVR